MRNLMPITRPMGAADLTIAAEDAGKLALALSDLARGVAAYEAATGAAIAVVDADKAVMVGIDLASGPDETVFGALDKTARRAVEDYSRVDHAQIYRDAMVTGTGFMRDGKRIDPAEVFAVNEAEAGKRVSGLIDPEAARKNQCRSRSMAAVEAMQDDELRDAMYPQPVPAAGTVEDAVKAGTAAVAELVSEPVPTSNVQKMHNAPDIGKPISPQPTSIIKKADNALPTWQGNAIPADLRDTVQHIVKLGTSGPKWGFEQDLDMIERAIDGQSEKLIADVMEFSLSHIRQRFNKLVDRTHAHGNRFTREQVREALRWMTGQDEPPAF